MILCKYCMREIVQIHGIWVVNNPNIVFPQYCGFPWTPEQKHEPKKEA